MSDYTPSGNPATDADGSSADMRAEFALIQAAIASKANSASPTLTTPALGVATATSINKITLTQPATGATLTILDGKTLTANHTLTLAGTDGTTMTFPATNATLARTDAAQTFTGIQDFDGRIDANAGLAVTGANFTSRGITDAATATVVSLSGSGANSITIANSATNPTIGTSAGNLIITGQSQIDIGAASQAGRFSISTSGTSSFIGATGATNAALVVYATGTSGIQLATNGAADLQVFVIATASADRYITLSGSNGGNPTIGTSAGVLSLASQVYLGTNATDYISALGGTAAATLQAAGASSDIQLNLGSKGTSGLTLNTNGLTTQAVINHTASADRYITLTGSAGGNPTIGVSAGSLALSGNIYVSGLVTSANATMCASSVAYGNGAAAATATMTNAPAAGNPTKWIPVADNGTTRYIPAW